MFRYKNLTSTGTGIVASTNGATTLWTVNVNTAAASAVLKLYDGTSASGALIATIDASKNGSYSYGVVAGSGLYFDLSGGNADVTLGYA